MSKQSIVLFGFVASEPVTRMTTKKQQPVTNVRFAVNPMADAAGNKMGETKFYTLTSFRAGAENLAKIAKKGLRVGVRGELEERKYTKADGSEGVENVITLGARSIWALKAKPAAGDDQVAQAATAA